MKVISFALLALVGSPALAHDFWLQPAQWQPKGSAVEVTLQVGHGPDRQRSPIRASRLTLLEAVGPDGSVADLHSALHLGDAASDLTAPDAPAMLVLVTDTKAESHLDPQRFEAHLQDEGLTRAIAWRGDHRQSTSEGSENYGRVAKLLLASPAKSNVIERAIGLELEIVPLADPHARGVVRLPVRVIFEGAPLQGATLKLYDLANDGAPKSACVTDQAGQCAFDIAQSGSWLVNVVWSTPNPAGSSTDFRTIFSSLSFGFDAPPAMGGGR